MLNEKRIQWHDSKHCRSIGHSVPYPELFWSWYTSLGSQTQTLKHSKVLISAVSFPQHSLSQSQESNVLSYSEYKIAKNFQGFAPVPHWGGLTALPQFPSCMMVFLLNTLIKKPAPPKNCSIQHPHFFVKKAVLHKMFVVMKTAVILFEKIDQSLNIENDVEMRTEERALSETEVFIANIGNMN